jgi:hypothetical protein
MIKKKEGNAMRGGYLSGRSVNDIFPDPHSANIAFLFRMRMNLAIKQHEKPPENSRRFTFKFL